MPIHTPGDPGALALNLVKIIFGAGFIAWATLIIKGLAEKGKLRLGFKTQADRNALDTSAQHQKAQAEERDDRRDDFKATIEGLTKNIDSLQRQLEQQQASAKQTHEGLQSQINTQGLDIAAQRAEIRSLREQVNAMSEERIDLLRQISALEMAKAAEKGRADAAERQAADLGEQVCSLREEIVKKDRAIRDLKADLRRVRGEKNGEKAAEPSGGAA